MCTLIIMYNYVHSLCVVVTITSTAIMTVTNVRNTCICNNYACMHGVETLKFSYFKYNY